MKQLLLSLIITLLCFVIKPIYSVQPLVDQPTLSVFHASLALGAIYGGTDALMNGKDVSKGFLDGANFGGALPGMIIGGTVGGLLGTTFSFCTKFKVTERDFIGWFSAGASFGSASSLVISAATLGNGISSLTQDKALTGLGAFTGTILMGTYLIHSAKKASKIGADIEKLHLPDYKGHNIAASKLRQEFGPGIALTIGLAKEYLDYLTPGRCAEWRDLQNDWNGIFGIKNYY